jgi:hypothetical protein
MLACFPGSELAFRESVFFANQRKKLKFNNGGREQAAQKAVHKWKWAPAPDEVKEIIEINFHPN